MIYILPVLIIIMIITCAVKKVSVYDCFIDGAKGGLELIRSIFPYICAIFVCIFLFKSSGLSKMIAQLLSFPLSYLGIPSELAELIFLIPLSGNGTIALLAEIIAEHGADSYIARCASVICGSSETIFYVAAVYFAACKDVKRLRYAIPVAIFATLGGTIIACALCRFM